jgi:pimeloyl-ACP methyl ester carboxylesterase
MLSDAAFNIPCADSVDTHVNNIRLQCLEAGDPEHPAVLLLHGFPEFSYSWRYQIPALAAAGFHVLAPDLRGYDLSDKPASVRDYRLEHLVADVSALIDRHADGRAALVGHDWGGVIAWHTAMWHPDRLSKLAILNAPHPAAYKRQLRRGCQLLRSWYALFFQLPWLPEAILQFNDSFLLRRLFRQGPARTSPSPNEDVRRYLTAISKPRGLHCALNYYRAALRTRSPLHTPTQTIHTPTLLIWGDQDAYLERDLTENLDQWVPHLRTRHLPLASHWVQHDEPDQVNRLLIDFLQSDALV